jgi:anaerobic magnesium-protoporphyrin IX monomethyl ester cyclase
LNQVASPRKPLRTWEIIQFGISYISALLKEHGHSTELVVLSRSSSSANNALLTESINRFQPGLICFSSVTTEYPIILEAAKFVKEHFPGIYTAVGGTHVSLNPEGVLDTFDALCMGEGEYPTLELVGQLESGKTPADIPNFWIKCSGRVEKNPARPFLQDLDKLPFPDREMWRKWVDESPLSRHTVLLGRGCPFECTYCCNHALKKLSTGKYTRLRSPGNIVSEIELIARDYPGEREVYLEVETIGIDREWVSALCEALSGLNKTLDKPLSFGTNIRISPGLDIDNMFKAFKKANFRFVNIGLESGSERVRREILNRNYSNADIIKAVKLAREYGLQVSFLNMLGLPGETLEDFNETIGMNRLCQPDWMGYSIFYPYPGTELYEQCRLNGFLNEPMQFDNERVKAAMNLPGFSKKQIESSYIWFEFNVYKGRRNLLVLLLKTAQLKLKSMNGLYGAYKTFKNLLRGYHP